ncbi:MAG: enoyl-CoA hydratase [Myxococcales bacterium]|nr:enoyl-CoA hydratase [Myxococcales bacterium]
MAVSAGDRFSFERTFTTDDVITFVKLSRDEGRHHLVPDAEGRLMVHGLLTATLPTRVGGSIDFLAREMVFEFLRPVFTGDAIHCEVLIASVVPEPGRTRIVTEMSCVNQHGKEVLRGRGHGVVLDPAP